MAPVQPADRADHRHVEPAAVADRYAERARRDRRSAAAASASRSSARRGRRCRWQRPARRAWRRRAFRLYSLPVEEQNMFKLIMLLPVGALVVVAAAHAGRPQDIGHVHAGADRAGVPADAADPRRDQLRPGRSRSACSSARYLSTLNLLLVARIATLVIVVVAIMSIVSVLSYRPRARGGSVDHVLPDDHPGVDDRADVDPVGRRRPEGSAGAGQRQSVRRGARRFS